MKITNILIHVLEVPEQPRSVHTLVQVPTVKRMQYTHKGKVVGGPTYMQVMRVQTDEGVEGICTVDAQYLGTPERLVETLKTNILGEDPLNREFIFQKLYLGTRWIYQDPGWFGPFDNCLWDIAGKVAGLPVCQLIGTVREGLPVYRTAGDGPVEMYIEHIEKGKEVGINAYKPHSYKGGVADIPIMIALREHVGPNYDLMLDPVCSYTLREAVDVARVLYDLDFVWLEEPFFEQKMNLYQELVDVVDIPILATERLMHDLDLTAQWLIQGATDRLRGNARAGTTQVLKLAHFAEVYGANIELNGIGGLFGQVHANLGRSIQNTDFYEQSGDGRHQKLAPIMGMMTPPTVVDGRIIPSDGPGWGAEWDMKVFEQRTVQVIE